MSANFRYLLVFFCVLLTVGADTFPAYNVKARQVTYEELLEMAEYLFGPDDYKITMNNGRYVALACDGQKRVEYDTVSGGVSATDNCESPDPADGPPEELPTEDEAIEMATELLTHLGLLPVEDGTVAIEGGDTSNTFLAHEYMSGDSGNYTREEYKIDIAANVKVLIQLKEGKFPVVGGGGKFQVTYGPCKKLIAVQALWRDIVGEEPYELISEEESLAIFLATLGPLAGNATVKTYMAYESYPYGVCQQSLRPVWVHEAEVFTDGQKVPVRPQNSRGMSPTSSGSGRRRDLGARSLPRNPRSAPASGTNDDDDDCKFEVGMEWLGEPYGLSLASENAAGFRAGVMHTAPIGNVTYEKRNENVWRSDWTTDEEIYADSVDMLWYTGHANSNGWMVADPATGATGIVDYTSFSVRPEVPSELLGHEDLEWLIIAACGPHQDEAFAEGEGNVFDRWRGMFHGLHIMFSYGTPSSDSEEEGAKFLRYAQEGNNLIDAWFRATKEVQPPGVVVTAMWADGARDDHLPGYGPVSSDGDSSSSQERWFMWTTC